MKNSSEFINASVFKVNQKYTDMQNKTKELFFKCLDEGRDLEYFEAMLDKLWGNLDRSFMEKELAEYESIIHENNMAMLQIKEETPKETKKTNIFFDLVAASVILATEKKFTNYVKRDYKRTLKSPAYQMDKQNYLDMKVNRYKDEKIVPYHNTKTGDVRYVSMATYNAMIHNTNMTRTAWNTTLNDADYMDYNTFYIPYHSFSCPHCVAHQEKKLTQKEVMKIVGKVEEQRGDILHPNCKCTLLIYPIAKKKKSKLSNGEKEEIYHTRQKVNTLTLEKSRIATDMKIQKRLGNMDEVDKLNQKRNKVNSQIRELRNSLPTETLQKQVVAINR
jgi:hypothetical protein